MTPEYLETIFDAFTRAENSTTNKVQGTGLGMAITKSIVELMGGNIGVESQRGKGSTFSFSIWVDSCEEEKSTGQQMDTVRPAGYMAGEQAAAGQEERADGDAVKQYGTQENKEALRKVLSKLILCVEMENWEKAEMFMDTIRQLAEGAPHEVGRVILRLKNGGSEGKL